MASTSSSHHTNPAIAIVAAPSTSRVQALLLNNQDAQSETFAGTINHFRADRGFGFIDVLTLGNPLAQALFPAGKIFFHIKNLVPKVASNAAVISQFLHKNVHFSVGVNPRNSGRICAQNVRLESYTGPIPISPVSIPSQSPPSDLSRQVNGTETRLANPVVEPGNVMDEWEILALDFDDKLEQDVLQELMQNPQDLMNSRQLRKDAIEMGFSILLVEQALKSVDSFGMKKVYRDLTEFLGELMEIQDEEAAHAFGSFDYGDSDDFQFNSWMAKAAEMGFSHDVLMEAMSSTTERIMSFQELLERVMLILSDRDSGHSATLTSTVQAITNPPVVETYAQLSKQNQDLRDYFTCKICMIGQAIVAFLPCGHICCCVTCGSNQINCPYCRSHLTATLIRVTSSLDKIVPPQLEDGTNLSIEDLKMENIQLHSQRCCVVCQQRDRASFFSPCGHVVSCLPCSLLKDHCPSCNERITKRTTIFFS